MKAGYRQWAMGNRFNKKSKTGGKSEKSRSLIVLKLEMVLALLRIPNSKLRTGVTP